MFERVREFFASFFAGRAAAPVAADSSPAVDFERLVALRSVNIRREQSASYQKVPLEDDPENRLGFRFAGKIKRRRYYSLEEKVSRVKERMILESDQCT